MFDIAESGQSTVRFVDVKNNRGIKRVRVNIIYEKLPPRNASGLADDPNWLNDAPPSIDLEGYEEEVPEWGGIEQEISSGVPDWVEGEEMDNEASGDSYYASDFWSTGGLDQIDGAVPNHNLINRKRKAIKMDTCFRYPSGSSGLCSEYPTVASQCNSVPAGKWNQQVSCLDGEQSVDINRRQCSVEPELRSGRTAYCRICELHVKSTHRRMHIYSCHLRRPIYRCPICDISSTYHISNIRVHIKKVHNVMSEPISCKEEYENEMNAFLYSCFGDHQIFRRQDPDVVACLIDILNCVSNGKSIRMTPLTDVCSGSIAQVGRDRPVTTGSIFGDQSPLLARTQSRNTCRLCFETNVKHLERHVLQHHIKQPMFLCPYCNFSSCYSPTSVKDHIKTRHSMLEPVPLDVRDEYAELIQTVYAQCFVDENSLLASRINFKQQT
uniref:C2H2-type domain-containing protein n=1 Tax=Haemonchus contortus TaxID=6289 RepID=A0A7I4YQU6_HAECO